MKRNGYEIILENIFGQLSQRHPSTGLKTSLLKERRSIANYYDQEYLNATLTELLQDKEKFQEELANAGKYRSIYKVNHKPFYYFISLGAVYLGKADFESANEYFQKALEFPKKVHSQETDGLVKLPSILIDATSQLIKPKLEVEAGALPTQICVENEVNLLKIELDSFFSKQSINDLYEKLGFVFNDKELSDANSFFKACFRDFPDLEKWRLFVDGCQQLQEAEHGWLGWEEREPNSISAMYRVFDFQQLNIDKRVDEQTLKSMHQLAVTDVRCLNGSKACGHELVSPGEYRTTQVGFKVYVGLNATTTGIDNLVNKCGQDKKSFAIEKYGVSLLGTPVYRFWAKSRSDEKISKTINDIIDTYHAEIEKLSQSKPWYDKLKAIVTCIQNLEQYHPFRDGNGRVTTALLNMLLIQNQFPPSILYDPNFFDAYTVDEMIPEVLKGMAAFAHVIKHGAYPNTNSSETIVEGYVEKAKTKASCQPLLAHDFLRAAQTDDLSLLSAYINQGIGADITDDYGNNALMMACYFGHTNCVKMILSSYPELINKQGQDGATAIYLAAYAGHVEIVEFLCKNDADKGIASTYGLTPIDIARNRRKPAIVELLESHTTESEIGSCVDEKNIAISASSHFFYGGLSSTQKMLSKTSNHLTLLSALRPGSKNLPLEQLFKFISPMTHCNDSIFHFNQIVSIYVQQLCNYEFEDFLKLMPSLRVKTLIPFIKFIKNIEQDSASFSIDHIALHSLLLTLLKLRIGRLAAVKHDNLTAFVNKTCEIVHNEFGWEYSYEDVIRMLMKFDVFFFIQLVVGKNDHIVNELFYRHPDFSNELLNTVICQKIDRMGRFRCLREFFSSFTDIEDRIIICLENNPKTLSKLKAKVKKGFDLRNLMSGFDSKNAQKAIFLLFIRDKEILKNFISSISDVKAFMKLCPSCSEPLLENILAEKNLIANIVKDRCDLINLLNSFSCQGDRDKAFHYVMEDSELFLNIFSDDYNVQSFVKKFPEYAHLLSDKRHCLDENPAKRIKQDGQHVSRQSVFKQESPKTIIGGVTYSLT